PPGMLFNLIRTLISGWVAFLAVKPLFKPTAIRFLHIENGHGNNGRRAQGSRYRMNAKDRGRRLPLRRPLAASPHFSRPDVHRGGEHSDYPYRVSTAKNKTFPGQKVCEVNLLHGLLNDSITNPPGK